jgi:FAD:protein FMN transferase
MNHKIEFRAMGCRMIAVVDTLPNKPEPVLLQQTPAWFEEWEQSLSRFRADSELNKFNLLAGWPVPVSETFWDVFQVAREAEQASGGLVTPIILEALVEAGYDRSFDLMPKALPTPALRPWYAANSLAEVFLDENDHSICMPIDMRLDFGGVAKGWAAHQAAKLLAGYGAALVSAGGDISIVGEQFDGRPWPVSIDNPFEPGEMLGLLMLPGSCGVATSGTDYRRWLQGGRLSHHIIDPRTGIPAQTDLVAATVVAPDAMQAEMGAKVALISGSDRGLEWIEARPEMAALLVRETGEVLLSEKMKAYFWRTV